MVKEKLMKISLILISILSLFITACSSESTNLNISKESRIDLLIQKGKYAEAKDLIEEILVLDPFHIKATKQHKIVSRQLPKRTVLKSEHDGNRHQWLWEANSKNNNPKKP